MKKVKLTGPNIFYRTVICANVLKLHKNGFPSYSGKQMLFVLFILTSMQFFLDEKTQLKE